MQGLTSMLTGGYFSSKKQGQTGDDAIQQPTDATIPDYGTQAPYPAPDGATALPPPTDGTTPSVASSWNWNQFGQNPRGYVAGKALNAVSPTVAKWATNPVGSLGGAGMGMAGDAMLASALK